MGTIADYKQEVDLLSMHIGQDLKTIVLFGSRARGDTLPGSDHDLLPLIIDNLPLEPIARMSKVRMVLDYCDMHLNTLAVTPSEFTKDISPMMLDLCKDGICLYGQDYLEPLRNKVIGLIEEAGLYLSRVSRDGGKIVTQL